MTQKQATLTIVSICGVLLAVALILSAYNKYTQAPTPLLTGESGQPMLPTTQLTIGDTDSTPSLAGQAQQTTLTVELATTPAQEEYGLSGRDGLAPNMGMLFLFDPPQTPGFWMKDMKFSLDIIYAAADGTIVTIYPDLTPSTYPHAFAPSGPVKYVLEVPAGFAAEHAIAVGQKIMVQ